jgi:hypothetical protein
MIRKTVLATAIIGVGLGSMTGAAFAGDDPGDGGHSHNWDNDHGHSRHHHGHDSWGHDGSKDQKSSSCTNNVAAANESRGGGLADVLGGAQTVIPVNACHILDDNSILNGNDISVL